MKKHIKTLKLFIILLLVISPSWSQDFCILGSGVLPPIGRFTTFFLSDTASTISGFKKLTFARPSGPVKHAVTATVDGTGLVPITNQPNGTLLQWITPPLVSNYTWITHVSEEQFHYSMWGQESHWNANVLFHIAYFIYRNGIIITPPNNTELSGRELFWIFQDYFIRPSGYGPFESGDRLVFRIYLDSVNGMTSGYTVTTYYNAAVPGVLGDAWFSLPVRADNPLPVFGRE